ncbi:hypothetical protein ACXDF8_22600 [Mycolicibacterium sp. CBM1]
MNTSDIEGYQPRAYPPSVLIGGAALIVVLVALVVSVVMVSAASVDGRRESPASRMPRPTTSTAPMPTAVAGQPPADDPLGGLLTHLTPQMPSLDRLLESTPDP